MKWSDSRDAWIVCCALNKDLVRLTGLCQHFAGQSDQTKGNTYVQLTYWLQNFNLSKPVRLVFPWRWSQDAHTKRCYPHTNLHNVQVHKTGVFACGPQLCVRPVDVFEWPAASFTGLKGGAVRQWDWQCKQAYGMKRFNWTWKGSVWHSMQRNVLIYTVQQPADTHRSVRTFIRGWLAYWPRAITAIQKVLGSTRGRGPALLNQFLCVVLSRCSHGRLIKLTVCLSVPLSFLVVVHPIVQDLPK